MYKFLPYGSGITHINSHRQCINHNFSLTPCCVICQIRPPAIPLPYNHQYYIKPSLKKNTTGPTEVPAEVPAAGDCKLDLGPTEVYQPAVGSGLKI